MNPMAGIVLVMLAAIGFLLLGIGQRLDRIAKRLDTIADNTLDLERERQKRGW